MTPERRNSPDGGSASEVKEATEGFNSKFHLIDRMREAERTTRQRIADRLREEPAQPGTLAREFEVTAEAVCSHVTHLARSLEHDAEQVLVAPPTCRECGFSEFDDLVNRPSRCPSCKSEAVEEPMFAIE